MGRSPSKQTLRICCAVLVLSATVAACSQGAPLSVSDATAGSTPGSSSATPGQSSSPSQGTTSMSGDQTVAPPFRNPLPGMPPVLHNDVYAADRAGAVSPKIAGDPAYIYVPNSFGSPHTTVIDQRTHKIVRILPTGVLNQHVTPSWNLRKLYVEASASNQLVTLNPRTGRIVGRIPVQRPYNLYFAPNGRQGIVMSEEYDQILFTDPVTFKTRAVVHDPSCRGPNHADFSGNGRFFVVTCEFSGSLLKVSTIGHRVLGRLSLGVGSKPQDVRLSPDGRTFYVADMGRNRLLRINWRTFKVVGSTSMPMMPHGIYPSRDGKFLYVSDRGAGEVSVISLATNRIVDTWRVPGGGSPDMGGISADGRVLWLSGRNDGYVYGWNTSSGKLIAKIWVGGSPHGLLVWPQPGRYSLGHTGNMR